MILVDWILRLWKRICDLWNRIFYNMIEEDEGEEEFVVCDYKVPNKIIGGYFWAGSPQAIKPLRRLNPGLMTHVYYAFLELHEDGTLKFQNESKAEFLQLPEDLALLKRINPNLKVLFSIITIKNSFSLVIADDVKRNIFVHSAYHFARTFGYDGIDLDWEFPKSQDKLLFVKLLSELSAILRPHNMLLTAAVRAIPIYEGSGYHVPEMVKYLNIINVMTYDFYGAWSDHTGFNSPLYPSSLDSAYERKYLNMEAAVRNWVDAGAPREKICIGIPFYGRTFTLNEPELHGIHAETLGGGRPPAITYLQIKEKLYDWERVWDNEQKAPYKFHLDQWLGYDDEDSIQEKVKFALEQDIGGVFVWHLTGDDVKGDHSHGTKQYLLRTIYDQIIEAQQADDHGSEKSSELSLEHVSGHVPDEEPKESTKPVSVTTTVEDVE